MLPLNPVTEPPGWTVPNGVAAPGLAVLPGTRLAEEVAHGGTDQVGRFFAQEVTGGERFAAHLGGVLLPDAERLVAPADEALPPPQHQNRALHLLPRGASLLCL